MHKDCSDCKVLIEWSGVERNLNHLNNFEERMVMNNGTLERIWIHIERRVTKPVLVTCVLVMITVVSTLFGLVYKSNQDILKDFVEVKSDIAVIKERVGLSEPHYPYSPTMDLKGGSK